MAALLRRRIADLEHELETARAVAQAFREANVELVQFRTAQIDSFHTAFEGMAAHKALRPATHFETTSVLTSEIFPNSKPPMSLAEAEIFLSYLDLHGLVLAKKPMNTPARRSESLRP